MVRFRLTVRKAETERLIPTRVLVEAAAQAVNAKVQATLTPEYAAGLIARSVRLLPVIRANGGSITSQLVHEIESRTP